MAYMSEMFRAEGRGNVVFNFVGKTIVEMAAFGAGYKRAGRAALEAVMSQPGYRDNDCYPVLYLYRHALELYLKAVVLRGAQLLSLTSDETVDTTHAYKCHVLTKFLPPLKAIFKDRGWAEGEGAKQLNFICSVIEEVSRIDEGSFVFRYPGTNKGKPATDKHAVLNVVSYAEAVEQVIDSLDAAATGLTAEWDDAAEIIYLAQQILYPAD